MRTAVIAGTILVLLILAAVMLFYMDTGSDATTLSEVTDQTCDVENRCPEGYTCMSFPETDGPRCAEPDAFEYYRCPIGTMLVIQESYPGTLLCSPHGILGMFR